MMLGKLFGKNKKVEIIAPMTGEVIPIEKVPDLVFSDKMVGDGVGIMPTEGTVLAPCDAEVAVVFPTKHAIGLKTDSGVEILMHIGLETVALAGEGFEIFVAQGDKVKQGDKLATFDMDLVNERCKSLISPIVISNSKSMKSLDKTYGQVTAGEKAVMLVSQ